MQHKKQFKEGYVLLEGVMFLGILAVLLAFMLPTYAECIKRAEEAACKSNCQQLEKLYEIHLMLKDEIHSEAFFEDFAETQPDLCCPEGGTIKFKADTITCDRHEVLVKAADYSE